MRNYLAIIGLGFLIIAGFLNYHFKKQNDNEGPKIGEQPVLYVCNESKNIDAWFYSPTLNSPSNPVDDPTSGSVRLLLSDGRDMALKQTISASGVRYANADESFVFWNKGNGALVLENNQEKSYIGCVAVERETEPLTEIYHSTGGTFSLRYPSGYTVDESYTYQALGPGKEIYGVKFTIPAAVVEGTNLSNDSYISIEQLPQTAACDPGLFLSDGIAGGELEIGDTRYFMANQFDAGAGNRYEETVLAISGTNPCTAIRYFIHYTALENYPDGTVRRFDADQLREEFGAIRDTLVLNQ